MPKATHRGAVLLGLVAAGLLLSSIPSFAEVQNVRVGGDITLRGFLRSCVDLSCSDDSGTQDNDAFVMATTGVNVGADLTENVSAFVRLVNERDWNGEGATGGVSQDTDDIGLSQAYVTLKELFYSPLTLRIGTQPIVWGRGFVLGSNLFPGVAGNAGDRNGAITANEYTDFTSFDAIRATLDLSGVAGTNFPLTADYVYIKSDENAAGVSDDVTIQGVNFGTRFDTDAEAELYYVNKRDKGIGASTVAGSDNRGSVNTIGIRGSANPVSGLSTWAELGYQWGKTPVDSDAVTLPGQSHQAWASDLGLEYTLSDVSMTPKVGTEWIFWSGNDLDRAVGGWDPIARGYYTTAIREFVTGTNGGFFPTPQAGDTAGATNQHQLSFWGKLNPVEDLTASSRLNFFWLDDAAIQAVGGQNERNSYAGSELDTQAVYNYTDDVQFGLLYAVYWPGDVYQDGSDNTAQQLVTTVSLKF